jgi:hypothetical protein
MMTCASTFAPSAMCSGPLPFYPYNPEVLQETTHAMRHQRRAKPNIVFGEEEYNPSSDWTLFFLVDSHS